MKFYDLCRVAVLVITCLQLVACGQSATATTSSSQPVKLEKMAGTDLSRITLTAEAARRLDLQTATVRDTAINGTARTVVPYAAVLYDTDGQTWTYVRLESLSFMRKSIRVDYIEGGQAVLVEGPPAGSVVVTVGAEELYGSETEFKEE